MTNYRFKLGMALHMSGLSFTDALALAKELGAEYGWFADLGWADGSRSANSRSSQEKLSDAAIDGIGQHAARHGIKLFMIGAAGAFSNLHLSDLRLEALEDDPAFRKDFDRLILTMQAAVRLQVGAVLAYTFAWPGEYSGR